MQLVLFSNLRSKSDRLLQGLVSLCQGFINLALKTQGLPELAVSLKQRGFLVGCVATGQHPATPKPNAKP